STRDGVRQAQVEIVDGIGCLEPRARVLEVYVNGIRAGKHIVEAIKEILFVASIMDSMKFGGIQKSAGIQPIGGDEISILLVSGGEPESSGEEAEPAVRAVHAAGWLAGSEAGLRRNFDHQAGFVAIFGRWPS